MPKMTGVTSLKVETIEWDQNQEVLIAIKLLSFKCMSHNMF